MQDPTHVLSQILDDNPTALAAWWDNPDNPHELTVLTTDKYITKPLNLPNDFGHHSITRLRSSPIRILRTPFLRGYAANANQQCQDEPIQLGTQIQPATANWVGTAGAPVSWIAPDKSRRWGILSNFHVMADGFEQVGHPQHQPDDSRPACARLAAWTKVLPDTDNVVDAAIADALIDGYHTIANTILDIGEPAQQPLDATVGLTVEKSGRTTGRTIGHCAAIGAAVNVGYGDFTARFLDQDVFVCTSEPFSAPGDSGSLIIASACHCPVALLFAGSDTVTIGNPFRYVADAFGLVFPFN